MHPKLGPLSEALETLAGQGGEVDELISDTDGRCREREREREGGREGGGVSEVVETLAGGEGRWTS